MNASSLASGSPIDILVVEDNPGDARLIREMLRGAPVALECADRLATVVCRPSLSLNRKVRKSTPL